MRRLHSLGMGSGASSELGISPLQKLALAAVALCIAVNFVACVVAAVFNGQM